MTMRYTALIILTLALALPWDSTAEAQQYPCPQPYTKTFQGCK